VASWETLLSLERRRVSKSPDPNRTEGERDYDRILFSTPVRRLADKTQVFPLERHDSVRTRLTHSLEVSNLCRSVGTALVARGLFPAASAPDRNVPAILAAVGLAHDLGNPPFGHQGEEAIRRWFAANPTALAGLSGGQDLDFLAFEGNAQSLRLVTRLQLISDSYGLNLTYGTLGALMKYSVPSSKANKKSPKAAHRKPGYFLSEREIVEEVLAKVGLEPGTRHPFAYIVEACDDLAYSVMDVEDGVKKGLVSFPDVLDDLESSGSGDPIMARVLEKTKKKYSEFRGEHLSSGERSDITMQKFRVYAIQEMVHAVIGAFQLHQEEILNNRFDGGLLEHSEAGPLHSALDSFNRARIYKHRTVLEVELIGHRTIDDVMGFLWGAIVAQRGEQRPPFESYVYSRISENYRRVFRQAETTLPELYRELQLLSDMIAGTTDRWLLGFHQDLVRESRGALS